MRNKIEWFVKSIFYPISLAAIAFLGWILKFSIPSAVIFSLMSFLPLFCHDGRGYVSLILLCPTMVYRPLNFKNLDISLIIVASSIVLSVFIFTILRHPKFRLGKLTINLAVLFFVFVISLIVNSVSVEVLHLDTLWFLLCMILILLVYILLTPLFCGKDIFIYFGKSFLILVSVLAIQIFIYYGVKGVVGSSKDIELGWVQSTTMASTVLVISLPFCSMYINKKKWLAVIPMILSLVAIYVLRTESGLICSILILIPLIFLTFKGYVHYPYFVISSFFVLSALLTVMVLVNDEFIQRVGDSLRYFGDFFKGKHESHKYGIEIFLTNPWIGGSINSLNVQDAGYIKLLDNTIITTLAMGGSIGLIAYVAFAIRKIGRAHV